MVWGMHMPKATIIKVANTFMEVNIGLNGNIVHAENIIPILHVGQNNIEDEENELEIQEIIEG
jgi:hypothetical protein